MISSLLHVFVYVLHCDGFVECADERDGIASSIICTLQSFSFASCFFTRAVLLSTSTPSRISRGSKFYIACACEVCWLAPYIHPPASTIPS